MQFRKSLPDNMRWKNIKGNKGLKKSKKWKNQNGI